MSCRVGQSVGRRVVVSSFFRFFLRCFERVSRRRQPINVDAEKDEKKTTPRVESQPSTPTGTSVINPWPFSFATIDSLRPQPDLRANYRHLPVFPSLTGFYWNRPVFFNAVAAFRRVLL